MPLSKNEEMKNEQLLITMPSDFSMPAASKNKNSIPMRKDKDVTMLSD